MSQEKPFLQALTKMIRQQVRSEQNEHAEAIFTTSSYCFDSAQEAAKAFTSGSGYNVYSRFSNPSNETFAARLAILEKADYGIATASGMAAINLLMQTYLNAGDHIVVSNALFGSSLALFSNILPKFGIEVDFVDLIDLEAWENAIRPNTKLFFLETPSNPLCEIIDLTAWIAIAKKHNILTCVDNCFSTPAILRPIEFGADIVMHSATKFLDGQGRFVGGALVMNDFELYEKLYSCLKVTGGCLSPVNAWAFSRSLETLELRMAQHCKNAQKVAQWLAQQDYVETVYYPGLESHPQHALAKQQQDDFGAIVSFEIKGRQEQAWKLIDAIKMLSRTGNFGDTRTTITHPYTTTHGRLSDEQKNAAGIKDNLIRLSIGLEKTDDIIHDLDQAVKAVYEKKQFIDWLRFKK